MPKFLAIAIIFLASWPATAEMVTFLCPKVIKVNQSVGAPSVPRGWVAQNLGTPSNLMGILFSDGEPTKLIFLGEPSSSRRIKGAEISRWNFLPSEKVWLSCTYGSTDMVLTQRLPEGTRFCDVTYKLDLPTRIECHPA